MKYNRARVQELLSQYMTKEVVGELVELNLGLLHKQLHKFYLTNDPEALSLGYEALYNAIITFDRSKTTAFSTYATVCIYNKLGSYVRSLNTIEANSLVYYDEPVSSDGSCLFDTLESGDTADGALLDMYGVHEIMMALNKCLATFTNPLQRQVINAWIKSDFKKTHVTIADEMGCTQSYASQIIKKFKYKLGVMLNEFRRIS